MELRWYQGRGDRKLLCNLVRLEMEAEISQTAAPAAGVFCRSAGVLMVATLVPQIKTMHHELLPNMMPLFYHTASLVYS